MDWTAFSDKLLPKVLEQAGLGYTCVSRNAAAQIVTAATIISAERRTLEKTLLRPYLELCQDSDVVIRKTALNNLKLIFQKTEPAEVERLFFSELVNDLDDFNAAIRSIVIDVVLSNNKLFSTSCLAKDFVPALIKEFEAGWKDADCWLLQNFAIAAGFLLDRGLLADEQIPSLTKFFDVFVLPHKPALDCILLAGQRHKTRGNPQSVAHNRSQPRTRTRPDKVPIRPHRLVDKPRVPVGSAANSPRRIHAAKANKDGRS